MTDCYHYSLYNDIYHQILFYFILFFFLLFVFFEKRVPEDYSKCFVITVKTNARTERIPDTNQIVVNDFL